MEQKARVVYSKKASEDIAGIALYIIEKGYPQTAMRFMNKLFDFGDSLSIFPYKYPICRNHIFKALMLRCAPFKNYLFVYSYDGQIVHILRVMHGSRVY